jgi:hypothetical protein
MEPHCALKEAKHLFKNKGYYHHNANDRFGIIDCDSMYRGDYGIKEIGVYHDVSHTYFLV